MRYYKLEIQDIATFELNDEKPYAPNIKFNIYTYDGGNTIQNFIQLINLPLEYFKDPKPFINKTITLMAGMKKTPLNATFGYKENKGNDLIFRGFIHNVISHWNVGHGNMVNFIAGKEPLDIKGSEIKPFNLHIKKGDDLVEKFYEAIKSLYPKVNLEKPSFRLESQEKIQEQVKSIDKIASIAKATKSNNKHLEIIANVNGYKIMMFETKDNGKTASSEQIRESKKASAIEIQPYMLLEMPKYISLNTCQFSIILNPSFQLNNLVKIPDSVVINNASQLSEYRAYTGKDNDKITSQLYFNGNFLITKIWHMGDSRNINPQQWATNFEALRYFE